MDKLKDTIRSKTGRRDPRPMGEIMQDVNRTLAGWFEYFRHSVRNVFTPLDAWVRQRLRTILRRRHKLRGRARGRDHQRWNNDYLASLGLISLALARRDASKAHS